MPSLIALIVVILALVWFWDHPTAADGFGALLQAAWNGPVMAFWNGPVMAAWNSSPPTLRVLVVIAVVLALLSMTLGGPVRRRSVE